jgi:serine/threonine-protein kinase
VSLEGALVLAEDVEIFAASDLPAEVRAGLPGDPDQFVLSRRRSRETSRVIDRDSRDLLVEFRDPTRIVDAILRFADRRRADPRATLESAFDMLTQLYRSSVLVSTEKRTHDPSQERLQPGTRCFGLKLGHRVQDTADTAVFFARDSRRRPVAVKVVEGGVASVQREAEAMRRAGNRVPEVYGVHEWKGRGVLVSEWLFGTEVTRAAAEFRGQREPRTEEGLLGLCCDVVEAFDALHGAGILHGDVHPHNVLVDRAGRARILDLGSWVDGRGNAVDGARGGVAFYMAPEIAAANLHGTVAAYSSAAEQYALATLVYLLWTGVHYLDFSLEKSAMHRQVTACEPASFVQRRVPVWPELEAVLRRGLAKDPGDRYSSCRQFAAALGTLLPEACRRDRAAKARPPATHDPGREQAAAFFERCGLGGSVLRDKPLNAPFASVHYGAAGIAYTMYKLAIVRDDPRLLATADVWAQKALVLSIHDEAFYTRELEINEKTVGRASLFHSPSGVHAVRALIALASSDIAGAVRAVSDFVTASRVPCEFVDVALGTSGLLLGCAELLDATRGASCDSTAIALRGSELRDELERLVAGADIASSVSISYLGIAHGWAGVLFALLRWSQATGASAEPYRAKLAELAEPQQPDGIGIRWPVANDTAARMSFTEGWCNGAAGHALLWALAHDRLGDSDYAKQAEQSAWSAWSSEITVGTICCGLAGIGYACAAAHRVTGDAVWLSRARIAARRACEDRSKWFYRDSLYKGAVGAVLLREELEGSHPATPFLER